MRWNCPHCGTQLAVSDDKLGAGWSFSRCYKCAGFALVRRADVNLIKVDRAPQGEPVLLPEAHEEPTVMLSKEAATRLSRYMTPQNQKKVQAAEKAAQKAAKEALKEAAKNEAVNAAAAQLAVQQAEREKAELEKEAAQKILAAERPTVRPATRRSAVAQPQPQGQGQAFGHEPMPADIAEALAAFAPPAPPIPPAAAAPASAAPAAPGIPARPSIFAARPVAEFGLPLPPPLPEEPSLTLRQRMAPAAIGLGGIFAIVAGMYLYVQAQSMWDDSRRQARETVAPPRVNAANANTQASNEIIRAPGLTAGAAVPNPGGVSDQLRASSSAPTAVVKNVEIITLAATLHSGPGPAFPVVGTAALRQKYPVEDTLEENNVRWFKIVLENPAARNPAQPQSQRKTAWIRSEAARPDSSNSR